MSNAWRAVIFAALAGLAGAIYLDVDLAVALHRQLDVREMLVGWMAFIEFGAAFSIATLELTWRVRVVE